MSVDPSGKFAYVANQITNNVSGYNIDAASGSLTAITNSPFAAGTLPISVTTTGKIQ
jgi:6-phosphogluconolactonase